MASEQEILALKKRRATIKASCTRVNTFVESVASITPSIAAQIEERKCR